MTEDEATIERARSEAIATIAHRGQVDKLGADYIDHPRRVAAALADDPVAECAGWLHDVIEDTDITAEDLARAGISPETVEIVALMTRRDDVPDEDYYAAIRRHPAALKVKLADLADNQAEWRVRGLEPEVRGRLAARYSKARDALEAPAAAGSGDGVAS